ncbi:hypothetical protein HRI_001449800 [Hibiscus trionum]|uniref:Gag-pol polyprotein n=1 Tax=Hibiscus trionum TaxID=183268 RepID=A0A9W7HI58_HIBTR|nr:hypothetical protein HRI_001449800 [Hibiscus trionum]
MADFGSTSSGIRKLNNHNYGYWETCIESYLQGQDLWEIVAGTDTTPPPKENAEALRKWNIKAGKALYILKTTIEEDLLEHIRDEKTPKAAWETLAKLFSKKNEARLQLLENELASISQGSLSIAQYFTKVKSIFHEISQLAPDEKVSEARMKRIIIHGLRPEYNGFITAVRGWPTQPSLVELENLLANQEELAKQMNGVTIKDEEEALFTNKRKGTSRRQRVSNEIRTQEDKFHSRDKSNISGGARCRKEDYHQQYEEKDRRQNGECFNCGRKGLFARDCRLPVRESRECFNCGKKGHFAQNCRVPKRQTFQGNMTTTTEEENEVMLETPISEEEWDAEAGFSIGVEQEELIEDMKETSLVATTYSKTDYKDEEEVKEDMEKPALATTIRSKIDYKEDWIVDSGCSNHMTNDEKKLQDIDEYKGKRVVLTANNSRLPISHIGKTTLPRNDSQKLQLEKVYLVPGLKKNLLSVPQLTAAGNYVLFGPEDVSIFQQVEVIGTPIVKGRRTESVYVLSAESAYVDKTRKNETADLWHERLGHVSYNKLKVMMKKQIIRGLPQVDIRTDTVCAGCQFGKAHQLPFKESEHQSQTPLELIHSDVFGPVKQISLGGMKYMVTFIDDFSRYVWVYFMKEKSETFTKFKEFKEKIESELNEKIQCLRTDNGKEYLSTEFTTYLQEHKIRRQLTCPNTPQQNGVAERKNRHLAETCRSMLHAKNVPGRFWAECMRTAAYVINRLPQAKLGFISPHEKLWKIKPTVSHLKVFGCVCYVFVPDHQRSKFDKKAIRCIFVGYDDARKEKVSEDNKEGEAPAPDPSKERDSSTSKDKSPWKTGVHQFTSKELRPSQIEADEPVQEIRRSTRQRQPNPRYANAALVDESIPIEPANYEEAARSPKWKKAMEEEIEALNNNQTWDLVPKPKDVMPISCKWVYKVKTRPDNSIERYKARLVARGFSQQYGIDYEETFSPVAKITTVRVLLALAANKSWKLWQMDVKNAFLHGELDKDIYMEQPRGFESKSHPEHVCKLKKALYGLKQAPRAWYGKIGDYYEETERTRKNLSIRFHMKELGELKHFLGLEVEHMKEGIFLGQQKYAKDLLQRYGMLDCKPISTPMDPNIKLQIDEGKDLEDTTMYRQLVGSLIYLTLSRPDITYAVGVASRYMSNPKKPHLDAVRRILRYVKGTINFGILYKKVKECQMIGYCDADYAGDHSTRRSTTGYIFSLGSGAISWCSKRQPTVSLSSTEAEYRSAASAAQESTWLKQLMEDLHQPTDYQVRLLCDNLSAIRLAENPVFHARTKHIEVHHHYIREKVLEGEIRMEPTKTDEQVADIFTKSLSKPKFEKFREVLGMICKSSIERSR